MRDAWLILVAVLALMGCVQSVFRDTRRFRYGSLGFKVIMASQEQIDRHCRKMGTRLNDRGEPVGEIACCVNLKKRTIWASWENPQCLVHELCHLDGRSNAECDKVHAARP